MLDQLRGAVGVLESVARDLEPDRLEPGRAAALLAVAARGKRVCGALETLLAGRAAQGNEWRRGGHRSAAHWVAATTGETVGAACRTIETARALDALPQTATAFRAGVLSATQAAEIASAASTDPAAERALLDAAANTSVKGLRDRCREVRAGAEADDRAWARRLHETRRAQKWTDPDGAYCLHARMAPDAGARFDAAWETQIERIFREARSAGCHEPRAAYAADALVALAERGPTKPPEVRMIVDHAALRRGHTKAGERCELAGVGPVPVSTARKLLDDAGVALMVRDGDDITRPAVSRPTRTIPAKLRRALEARYPSCGARSCANDRGLEIDHVVPIEDGGPTSLDNTWRLCRHHHMLKTYGRWRVVSGSGHRDLVPPDDPDPP